MILSISEILLYKKIIIILQTLKVFIPISFCIKIIIYSFDFFQSVYSSNNNLSFNQQSRFTWNIINTCNN